MRWQSVGIQGTLSCGSKGENKKQKKYLHVRTCVCRKYWNQVFSHHCSNVPCALPMEHGSCLTIGDDDLMAIRWSERWDFVPGCQRASVKHGAGGVEMREQKRQRGLRMGKETVR